MITLRCQFGVKAEERRYEYHNVYIPQDSQHPGFPSHYWPYDKAKSRIWILEVGEWIQTIDGFICPIIRASQMDIRLPGHGNQYRKRQVANNRADIYFEQPDNYYFGRPKNGEPFNLSRQQKIFCWTMAKSWDVVAACRNAGYKLDVYLSRGYTLEKASEVYAERLLVKPKIQEAIKMSIRLHLQALNMGEETLALNKKDALMNDMITIQSGLRDLFLHKMQTGQPIVPEEMTMYLELVTKLSGEINTVADWLGYGKAAESQSGDSDGSEFSYRMIEANVKKANTKNNLLQNQQNIEQIPVEFEVAERDEPQKLQEQQNQTLTPVQMLTKKIGVNHDDKEATTTADTDTDPGPGSDPAAASRAANDAHNAIPTFAGSAEYPLQPTG